MAIKLEKDQRINLEKSDSKKLVEFCVGVNWGAIGYEVEKVESIGLGKKKIKKVIDVDLDLSCVIFNSEHHFCDHLYSPLYKRELLARFALPSGKLVSDPLYCSKKALIMAELYKKNGEWRFHTISEAFDDNFLGRTVIRIAECM
jgi:stress response protein SCP2